MGMYKSNISPEVEKARSNNESVEAFLARGGKIQKLGESAPKKRGVKAKSGMIDAQKFLDEAIANNCVEEAIEFLKSQNIEVQ